VTNHSVRRIPAAMYCSMMCAANQLDVNVVIVAYLQASCRPRFLQLHALITIHCDVVCTLQHGCVIPTGTLARI